MKFFSTQLISILTFSAALAIPVMEKRDDSKVSESCKEAVKQYEECINSDINISNLNSVCANFKSDKCQNFYKNGYISSLSECKNDTEKRISFANNIFEASYFVLKYRCTNDENGNICPMNKYDLESNNYSYSQALKETCKSKACTDAYSEYVNSTLGKLENIGNQIDSKINESFSKIENKINNLGDKIDENVENIGNKIENDLDNMNDEIDNNMNDLESKLDKAFDKRDFNAKSQVLRKKRDHLLSVDCVNYKVNYLSSDATTLKKTSTFVITFILIIATLL